MTDSLHNPHLPISCLNTITLLILKISYLLKKRKVMLSIFSTECHTQHESLMPKSHNHSALRLRLRLVCDVDCGLSCDCVSCPRVVASLGRPASWVPVTTVSTQARVIRCQGRAWEKFKLLKSVLGFESVLLIFPMIYLSVISGVVDIRNYRWQSLNVPQCGVTPDPVKSWHNPLNWNLTDDENQQMSSKPFISETGYFFSFRILTCFFTIQHMYISLCLIQIL